MYKSQEYDLYKLNKYFYSTFSFPVNLFRFSSNLLLIDNVTLILDIFIIKFIFRLSSNQNTKLAYFYTSDS